MYSREGLGNVKVFSSLVFDTVKVIDSIHVDSFPTLLPISAVRPLPHPDRKNTSAMKSSVSSSSFSAR